MSKIQLQPKLPTHRIIWNPDDRWPSHHFDLIKTEDAGKYASSSKGFNSPSECLHFGEELNKLVKREIYVIAPLHPETKEIARYYYGRWAEELFNEME